MLEANITPIWIFDGPAGKEKEATLRTRNKIRTDSALKYQQYLQSNDLPQALTHSRRASRLSLEECIDVQRLLHLSGIDTALHSGEADILLASVCLSGQCRGVMSEDGDILARGVDYLYRSMDKDRVEEYSRQTILSSLDIGQDRLVDMCILLGTDYNGKIQGMGPVGILKGIKNKGIEGMIDPEDSRWAEIIDKYQGIRDMYRLTTPGDSIVKGIYDRQGVDNMLEERGFNRNRIDKIIDRLDHIHNKGGQIDEKKKKKEKKNKDK